MRLPLILLAAAAVAATPLVAQQMSPPGSKDQTRITGGTYAVDPGHTLIVWEVDHLGFSPYWGMFGDITGSLTLDPKNPGAAKVDITIPVAKVTTVNAALTGHLLKPATAGGKADFFGANPADAKFVSTKVVASGDTAKITGNLTLNGVTKPVTLDASFYGAGQLPQQMGGKENVGFRATGTIKRSDFGVSNGIPLVSDEVKLQIAAAFEK